MKTYLVYVLLYCVACSCIGIERQDDAFELKVSDESEPMTGTLERIVKTYHCAADNVREQQIILYGTKAWTFPIQDVNLTLSYPSKNPEANELLDAEDYIITGLLVVLHIDGSRSRGYVTQGGILTDHITMTFVIENITRLSYQFWLYGVNTSYVNVSEYSWQPNLC